MKTVLVIDTALEACSVGLGVDGVEVAGERLVMERGHAEELLPMIARVLAAGSLDYSDLDGVCVTLGPGRFTGIRVGLSTAKALGVALDIPVYGINSFDALSLGLADAHPTLCILESKREDFFVQSFHSDYFPQPVIADADRIQACLADAAAPLNIVGDGALRWKMQLDEASLARAVFHTFSSPCTKDIVAALHKDPAAPYFTTQITAFYMRGADVSVSKHQQRRLAGQKDI